MAVPLVTILKRLKEENLHGPTLPFMNVEKSSVGQFALIGNEYQDMDSKDPRWFDLFKEFFIDDKHQVQDDLLFFVRQYVDELKSSTQSINELEPVFVRRRVPDTFPALSDVIDWKQSFFLNLISQLPCTLTIAACTKTTEMKARQRITKKVFAAPFKSRMDVKDAVMNECSFPLVYYTVNDYDSSLNLEIHEGEYMCVELSLTVPLSPSPEAYASATSKVAEITLQQDSNPFPLPSDYTKVILFQGAVSYSSLLDIYLQKGLATQNQIRGGWRIHQDPKRTEYILIRGPNSKGQGQIAISNPHAEPEPEPFSLKNVFFRPLKSPTTPKPSSLLCSMTFIAIPWQSVSMDIIQNKLV